MKKLITLALAGALSLAVLGVGYALWFDTLEIHGTVQTGTVDVVFSGPLSWDDEAEEIGLNADGSDPDLTVENKDVGTCDAFYPPDAAGALDLSTLMIAVGNAYPSYDCYVRFDIHSVGSIPVHFQVSQQGSLPSSALHWDCIYEDNDGVADPVVVADPLAFLADAQFHFSDVLDCVLRIHFTNTDPIQQGQLYDFWWTIMAHQWNETPAPAP